MIHQLYNWFLASELTPFQHKPLSSPTTEIRLLHIRPAKKSSEPIRCTLTHHTLLSLSPSAYTALSYVWGPPSTSPDQHPPTITISSHSFPVSPNLHTALQHLRSNTEERIFWIDAICINQADNEEKGKQVAMMKDIYARAQKVVIWLGPAKGEGNTGTDTAMHWIDKLGGELVAKGIEKLGYEELLKWERDEDERVEEEHEEHEIKQVKRDLTVYMEHFLQWMHEGKDPLFWRHSKLGERPWFSRAWCLQECANGSEVVMQCGYSTVDFTRFWAVAYFIKIFTGWAINRHRTGDESVDDRTVELLDAYTVMIPGKSIGIRRIRLSRPLDKRLGLKALLARVNVVNMDGSRTDVTLPIDRVYALLGIANDEVARAIAPVYGLKGREEEACAEAYISTAKALLRHGHLDILGVCRRRAIERCDMLPSWAPDWAGANLEPWTGWQEDGLFSASGSTSPNISFSEASANPPLMCIDGIRVDTIQECGHEWTIDRNKEIIADNQPAMAQLLADVSRFVQQSPRYSEQQREEGIWRIPISDLEQGGVVNWARRATTSAREGWKILSTLCNDDHEYYAAHPEHAAAFRSYIGRFQRMQNAKPWIGKDGYVGMCPVEASEGDAVVVFHGAKVPYVLRNIGDANETRWILVGECFAYGAMDGEAMGEGRSVERFAVQ